MRLIRRAKYFPDTYSRLKYIEQSISTKRKFRTSEEIRGAGGGNGDNNK